MGILTIVFVGLRSINKSLIGTYILGALVLLAVAELGFGLSRHVSEALGRSSTLSGRTELWAQLLKFHTNPIFGTGFESFWLGDRLQRLAEIYWWHPRSEEHTSELQS